MFTTNRLGWLARTSFAALLSLGFIACSDDGGNGDPEVDAMQPPDAPPCEGHACDGTGVTALPEAGTLRVEYLHVGNDANGNRVEAPLRAYLAQFEDQVAYDAALGENSPRPYLGPAIANSDSIVCYDQTAYDLFFTAYHPQIQDFVSSRTYYADGPDSITMTASGGPSDGRTLDLIKTENALDPADFVTHPNLWLGTGEADALARGALHSIEPQQPDTEYPGFDIPAGGIEWDGEFSAAVAPDFTLNMPTEAEFYGGLVLDPNNDLPMGFTLLDPATIPDNWPTPVWFAGFGTFNDYDDAGPLPPLPTVEYLCLGPAGRDTTNNDLVIPQGVIAAMQNDGITEGVMITGIITHTAWALNETHRFDSVAMNCDLGNFSIPPAAQ